jgi:hypothetical protein
LAVREEISKSRLDRIRGVERHDRLDAELYNDFESAQQKKVCALQSDERDSNLMTVVVFSPLVWTRFHRGDKIRRQKNRTNCRSL